MCWLPFVQRWFSPYFQLISVSRTLEELNLEDNDLGAEAFGAIGYGLSAELSNLKKLNLAQNCGTDEGATEICQALEKNTSLTSISFAANGLGEDFAKSLSGKLTPTSTTDYNNKNYSTFRFFISIFRIVN